MRMVVVLTLLVIAGGCAGRRGQATPMPSNEAIDRFLEVIQPGKRFTHEEIDDATNRCFLIGAPASAYERIFKQAAETHRADDGSGVTYWFYPGKSKGQEGEYGVWVAVKGNPGQIQMFSSGILIN